MNKKIPALICALFIISSQVVFSQLNVSGAQFFIESGAEVSVQGDLTSTADILGPGKIVLNGTSNQNVNTAGFIIPNLEVNNNANTTLTGNITIGNSLLFTSGKIITGNFSLILTDTATVSGMGNSKFVETTGTGQVIKELTADVTSNEIPVGAGTLYRPAFVTTLGTYNNANVGVRVLGTADPNSPPSLSDYVTAYWPVTRTGITGIVTITGQYNSADVSGAESNLRGYYYNGTDWSSATESHTNATHQVAAQIPSSGDLAAMDKFDILKTRVFLQGAYNTSTGVMSDALRTAGYLPASDPYRTAPYNTTFTHVNNAISETVTGTPFANSTVSVNDNIVDWVFLELRNTLAGNPGANVVQTRSALIQRDGDIVDVDGISPVTFNNVTSGNYTIAVRHRNHIGISADPTTNLDPLDEKKSTAALLDFTTASDAQIFGTSAAFSVSSDSKILLWAGNANGNSQSKYQGPSNDRAGILTDLGNNELNTLSGYYRSDMNMNGQVKYQGPNNDRAYLLSTVLANNELTVRTQQLPD